MDAAWLRNAETRTRNLEVAGNNIIGGGLPASLRTRYLSWRDEVERFVTEVPAEVAVADVSRLQTPRHRDLVAGNVPADQLYREVTAEVRTALSILDTVATAVRQKLASAEQTGNAPGIEFTADSGRVYVYRMDAPLGAPGQYGAVFDGHDDRGAAVAVKRVDLRTSERYRADDARLGEREVEIGTHLAGLGDHLVPILDVGRIEGALLLVMPRASESLADRIAGRGPASSEEAAEVIRQTATGLQRLAALNVVHRDIKPSNILLLDGRWCLSDFGVARRLDVATATLTWMGTGTVEYRAPEVWRDLRELPASDLYALGCVAYEVLTANRAFPGPNFREQHETLVPELPPDCDPSLAGLIHDLLAKTPSARPADARQVLQRLAPVAELTVGQRGLQRIMARGSARRAGSEADDAVRRQHVERQNLAREALRVLWREVVAQTRKVDPEPRSEAIQDHAMLDIGDAQIRLTIAPTTAYVGELLLLAFIDVSADEQRNYTRVGSLLAVWRNDAARWLLCPDRGNEAPQEDPEPEGPAAVLRLHLAEVDLLGLWHCINTGDVVEEDVVEPASSDRIIELAVDGIERSDQTPPSQSHKW